MRSTEFSLGTIDKLVGRRRLSDGTTISNEETSATIVYAQQPRTETQQAEIDYQQQGFNLALVDYDRQRCVHQEIEQQTKLIPSKTAIA